jgi:hypothetical protein
MTQLALRLKVITQPLPRKNRLTAARCNPPVYGGVASTTWIADRFVWCLGHSFYT